MRFRLWLFSLCTLALLIIITGLTYSATFAAQRSLFPLFGPRKTCQSGWIYDHISVKGYPLVHIGPPYLNYNGTNEQVKDSIKAIFKEKVNIAFSIQYDRTWNLDVILASVTKHTGLLVFKELELNVENEVSFDIPPHKTGYTQFDVHEVEVQGNYYYQDRACNLRYVHNNLISYCPWYAGWDTKLLDGNPYALPNNHTLKKG